MEIDIEDDLEYTFKPTHLKAATQLFQTLAAMNDEVTSLDYDKSVQDYFIYKFNLDEEHLPEDSEAAKSRQASLRALIDAFNLFLGSHIVRTYHCLPVSSYEVPVYESLQSEPSSVPTVHAEHVEHTDVPLTGVDPSMMHVENDELFYQQYLSSSVPSSPHSVCSPGSIEGVRGLDVYSESASSDVTSLHLQDGLEHQETPDPFLNPELTQSNESGMPHTLAMEPGFYVAAKTSEQAPIVITSLCFDEQLRTRVSAEEGDARYDIFMVAQFGSKNFEYKPVRCQFKGVGFQKLCYSDNLKNFILPFIPSRAPYREYSWYAHSPEWRQKSIDTLVMALDVCRSYFVALYETAYDEFWSSGKKLPDSIASCRTLDDFEITLKDRRSAFSQTQFFFSFKSLKIDRFMLYTRRLVRQMRRHWGTQIFDELPPHVKLADVRM